jgi:hypothetical protein
VNSGFPEGRVAATLSIGVAVFGVRAADDLSQSVDSAT